MTASAILVQSFVMIPVVNNLPDTGWCDTEHGGQFNLRYPHFGKPSNVGCLLIGQFGGRVLFASVKPHIDSVCKTISALFAQILGVLFKRSDIEVFRVNAPWNVLAGALMQDKEAFRNWSIRENPRGNVGIDKPLPFLGSWIPQSSPNDSVHSGWLSDPIPQPVCGSDENAFPKPFWKRLGKTLLGQVFGRNLDHSSVLCRFGLQARPAFSLSQIS